MALRTWLSLLTFIAIVAILYFARRELITAWYLLWDVNLWILALLIPAQLISYYAVGGMIFDYLRAKGDLKDVSRGDTTRMALELNFVNHALPSGGVSGFSYMGWRLKKLGISPGRATMAQVVRFAMSYVAFLVLLVISLVFITIDGTINRFTILVSSVLATGILLSSLFTIYIIGSEMRLKMFSKSLTNFVNSFGRKVLRKKYSIIRSDTIRNFFEDLHKDYIELRAEKRILKKPLVWAFVFTIADIGMYIIAFASIGVFINPAMLVIAYGIATLAGFVVITPGGAGAFEFLMISFLGAAGAPQGATITAILLTRTILIVGTILTGYLFYQLTIMKYGKQSTEPREGA